MRRDLEKERMWKVNSGVAVVGEAGLCVGAFKVSITPNFQHFNQKVNPNQRSEKTLKKLMN